MEKSIKTLSKLRTREIIRRGSRRKTYKSQKNRGLALRLCCLVRSEATPIKSHQHYTNRHAQVEACEECSQDLNPTQGTIGN